MIEGWMGELIELSYRCFPLTAHRHPYQGRVLAVTERHKPGAVKRAWDCLRRDAARTSAQCHHPLKELI